MQLHAFQITSNRKKQNLIAKKSWGWTESNRQRSIWNRTWYHYTTPSMELSVIDTVLKTVVSVNVVFEWLMSSVNVPKWLRGYRLLIIGTVAPFESGRSRNFRFPFLCVCVTQELQRKHSWKLPSAQPVLGEPLAAGARAKTSNCSWFKFHTMDTANGATNLRILTVFFHGF